MLGVGLALVASFAWGIGDFIGGVKARVLPVLSVLVGVAALASVVGTGVKGTISSGGRPAAVAWGYTCTCRSMRPGSTSFPVAAITAFALSAGICASTAEIRP